MLIICVISWEEEIMFHSRKMQGNVKLSLCLTKHHVMKAYGEAEVYLHAFLSG
jgi:hypothetical protein